MVLASYKEYLLTIRDPVPDDAQTYWCIMHNATLKSNSLKLTVKGKDVEGRRKEMFYLTTHSTDFIYGYMAMDI